MLKSILAPFSGHDALPISAKILFSITAVFMLVTIWIHDIFKPPHKRRDLNGKPWKMPPGPTGFPLFGSLYDVRKGPKTGLELRRFGEMATLQVGSKTWVVLNSIRTVNEIINKRGSITNGRPDYPVSSDLMSRSKRSVLLKVPEWSDRRRVTHQVLSGSAMKSYAEYQDVESLQLLTGYVYQPSKWYQHHARYSNSTIYRIAFGKRVLSLTPQLAAIRQVHEDFLEHNPPNNIIDCFPRLSNLPRPFQWWRKSAEKLGQRAFDVYKGYWDPVLREIQEGQAPASFARDLLVGDDAKFKGSNEDAMYLSGELIEAGSETTRISHNSFVMAAICYPHVIQKARAELDQVCGNSADRLPNFDDEPSLTYILAFIKELLRWKPIIVWGTEHCLTEDLEFEGYRFPKHTNFVINNAATAQDTDYFENPDDFRPERWLDGRESDILHGTTTFGGGRRVCVGYRLAQKSLYLNIARLIYCFDFYSDIPLNLDELDHHAEKEPFPATIRIRSEKHRRLIVDEAKRLDILKFVEENLAAQEMTA